jgi:hypothetical protein
VTRRAPIKEDRLRSEGGPSAWAQILVIRNSAPAGRVRHLLCVFLLHLHGEIPAGTLCVRGDPENFVFRGRTLVRCAFVRRGEFLAERSQHERAGAGVARNRGPSRIWWWESVGGPRHHSATVKQYCPSSSAMARHFGVRYFRQILPVWRAGPEAVPPGTTSQRRRVRLSL